jgi:hypothetical protein
MLSSDGPHVGPFLFAHKGLLPQRTTFPYAEETADRVRIKEYG